MIVIHMIARYVEMSDPHYNKISAYIRESFPQSCILWIEEIINPVLRQAYDARKATMPIPNEHQLFHGTKEEVITTIAAGGFDQSFNTTSAYGMGTYFARDASYSHAYMRPDKKGVSFMFLCDVLVGKPCQGTSRLVIDTTKYDSAVDHSMNPSIFVTPHADGAYPKYIIAFHKLAK